MKIELKKAELEILQMALAALIVDKSLEHTTKEEIRAILALDRKLMLIGNNVRGDK
jgi:hypothetical protein